MIIIGIAAALFLAVVLWPSKPDGEQTVNPCSACGQEVLFPDDGLCHGCASEEWKNRKQ